MTVTRRRFIQISAALAATGPAWAGTPVYTWQGIALGARATIRLRHPDAQAITAAAATEIARLEGVFSLYRADSALMRLNGAGRLEDPPFELLECLTLAGALHQATGGLFDPTVQRLWQTYATALAAGRMPAPADLAAAQALTGWGGVQLDAGQIRLQQGMALTLNGIAQGFIADRIAQHFIALGLRDVLIDTGEMRAVGGHPDGSDWPVTLASGGQVPLRGRALATSAPMGTVLDAGGRVGHIIDPRNGQPAASGWQSVSVSADSAALADGLSTALCLADSADQAIAICAKFQGTRIEALI